MFVSASVHVTKAQPDHPARKLYSNLVLMGTCGAASPPNGLHHGIRTGNMCPVTAPPTFASPVSHRGSTPVREGAHAR